MQIKIFRGFDSDKLTQQANIFLKSLTDSNKCILETEWEVIQSSGELIVFIKYSNDLIYTDELIDDLTGPIEH
jgi:hypothetical protein